MQEVPQGHYTTPFALAETVQQVRFYNFSSSLPLFGFSTYGRKRLGEIIDKGEEAAAAYIIKIRGEEQVNADAESSEPQADDGSDDNTNSPQAVSSGA